MKRHLWCMALFIALALVASACAGSSDDTTTTSADWGTTTTRDITPPSSDSVGAMLDSGGCGPENPPADYAGYHGKINKIIAVDSLTVQFDLCSTDPAFLPKLSFLVHGVQPAEHLEATGGAPIRNPIGTGPYKLVEWVPGDSIVFERFDDYYGPKPTHSTAILRWSAEAGSRLLELQAVPGVDGITFPSINDYPEIEGDADLALVFKPEPNILYVAMTNTFAPFDNPDVRKALAVGIDRQRIVDDFYPPGSEVASHFTPCSIEHGCEGDAWYDYDPAAGRQLLADAGFPNGFNITIFYRDVVRGYLPEPSAVATDIKTQLKDNLNIDATIEVMESGAFVDAVRTGSLDGIYLFGLTGVYPHISNFFNFHFSANNAQFGVNDPSYTELVSEASKTIDPAVAAPLYAEANNAVKEFVPMVPIVHSATAFAYKSDVKNAYAPPWGQVLFHLMDNGEDTLVFMQGAEPLSLYCADESDGESLRPCAQVVEGLYGIAPNGDVVPQLATECAPNEDGTVWTCTLRNDVKFHDGSDLDANDVVVSFSAGLDAANPLHVGNTGAWTYYDYLWDGLINAE